MHIVTVVGARPQFVKAAPLRRALMDAGIRETLVHTGQHYDPEMSAVFFEELGLPDPAANLGVGSGTHAVQTGETMMRLEALLMQGPPPDGLIVYGDTNSTLAGALVAAKLGIPIIHVEAGLRSFRRHMPEEINRVVTDRLASVLCCPTQSAVHNLSVEGIVEGVHLTGDVMLDATRLFADAAERRAPLASVTTHAPGAYYVATVHRARNTDDPERLAGIFDGLGRLGAPVVVPLHPRTRERLAEMRTPDHVETCAPLSYLRMLTLVRHARAVLTDFRADCKKNRSGSACRALPCARKPNGQKPLSVGGGTGWRARTPFALRKPPGCVPKHPRPRRGNRGPPPGSLLCS